MEVSNIVKSLCGRDSGDYFFIIGMDDTYVYLANGKGRPVEKPKKKKIKHVRLVEGGNNETSRKIISGDKIQNSELRRALAAFAAESGRTEGGL